MRYTLGRNHTEVIPLILPMKNFVPMNFYHIIRILCDLLENIICWYGMILCYAYYIYLITHITFDCNYYVRYLVINMDRLRFRMRKSIRLENQSDILKYIRNDYSSFQLTTSSCRILAATSKRMTMLPTKSPPLGIVTNELQASILDYFNLIAFYNKFISFSALLHIVTWIFYSTIVFVRILRPSRLESVASYDYGVQVEFYLFFGWCFLMVLMILVGSSVLDSQAHKLYKAITNAMILDNDHWTCKIRWMTLASHFYPKRIHCFTFLGHKLSWLFCLRVS